MEIQVQCMDGDASSFIMNDEQVCLDLIDSIKPSELFRQALLRIQSGKRTSIFSVKAVESIFFATPLKARVREHPAARHLTVIPEKDYLAKLDLLRLKYAGQNTFEPGTSVDILGAIQCVSGRTYYLQMELTVRHRVEQLMDLHNLLERMTGVIPCSPEGCIAINPANIKRIEVYPAPQETMRTAWLVD